MQQRIELSPGPEDFALQTAGPRGARLLIAARDRSSGKNAARLWSLDLNTLQKQELAMPREVWAAGITLHDGHLYFTNKPPKKRGSPSIEVFALQGDTLTHAESFENDELELPNDVIVHPSGDLYVTDFDAGILYRVDRLTKRWSEFVSDIAGPNGLATNGSQLFVSALKKDELHVYDSRGALQRKVELPGSPDNLQWEVEGQVLDAAVHPSKKIFAHLFVPAVESPSRVCRIRVDRDFEVETIADFDDFAGGSTALVFDHKLYVSQVRRDQLLIEEL
jgi:hypothetical protein